MNLRNAAGETLDFQIEGYEFPGADVSPDEAENDNWLIITVRVWHRRGAWTATDPCLQTWDVAQLIAWLEAIQAGEPVDPQLGFVEPNLFFEIESTPDLVLKVYFDLELLPPWAENENVWLAFELSPDGLAGAIAALHMQLEQFPPRGEFPSEP